MMQASKVFEEMVHFHSGSLLEQSASIEKSTVFTMSFNMIIVIFEGKYDFFCRMETLH